MEQNLRKLYNTLATIETRGAGTITMADCLRYLEQLITEEANKPVVEEQPEPKKAKK